MGAAKSTTRINGAKEERHRASGGSSTAAGAALALAAVGVAAWGISRMASGDTEKDDEMNPRTSWSPPPVGQVKMNTNGTSHPQRGSFDPCFARGLSGYAGVLRDHRGKWVQAFHGFIGVSDPLTAEFYGIYYGLKLLDKRGLKGATLESGCYPAVVWIINDENDSSSSRCQMVIDCWEMIIESRRLCAENNITLSYCYCVRESNQLAEKLTDMAIKKRDKYKEITVIPAGRIKEIVDQESLFT